jgi:HAD superfamily hydrolase (TIGR01509 family)
VPTSSSVWTEFPCVAATERQLVAHDIRHGGALTRRRVSARQTILRAAKPILRCVPMVRAVVFDLFETLVTELGTQPTRVSSIGAALGLEREAFRTEWKAARLHVVSGRLSFGGALTQISRTLAGRVDTIAIERACDQRMREKAAVFAAVDQEVSTLILQLRAHGISLAVVSNCFAEDVRGWPAWPLAREFQQTVFSCVAGVAKPDPAIYLKAIRGLGIEPDTAVFIGDGGDDELAGAESAGLRAFRADWFSRRRSHAGPSVPGSEGLASPEDVLRIIS